jgi:hypothetical protein
MNPENLRLSREFMDRAYTCMIMSAAADDFYSGKLKECLYVMRSSSVLKRLQAPEVRAAIDTVYHLTSPEMANIIEQRDPVAMRGLENLKIGISKLRQAAEPATNTRYPNPL